MTIAPVTSLYVALLAFLFVFLSIRVIGRRRSSRVALGTGDDRNLERRTRVQANFAEYVPLALILLLLVEIAGLPRMMLHAAGTVLVIARILHAIGVSGEPENFRLRTGGMAATFSVILFLAVTLLVQLAFK